MQQGMEYMQQGIGYIQKIISSGKHTKVNTIVPQGYRYDSEKGLWIENIQRPPGSIFDMNKPHQGDEYENRQGISDIQRPSRSFFDMNKPQQGEYENRQGIAYIHPPSRSFYNTNEPQQGVKYENRQGIVDIHPPSLSVSDISKLPKVDRYENLQGIDCIQPPSRSIPHMKEALKGDKYENYRQGIQYVREKNRSETFYDGYKDEKPIEQIQIIVRSNSDDVQLIENISGGVRPGVHSEVDQNRQLMEKKQALKRSAEDATEHVDQQGIGIIDVKEMSVWFQDVLQVVENDNKLRFGYIIAKERQLLKPGVFQVLQYLDLHGIQNIRYRAQEELKLFAQQYDCIEKHPKAHEKFKALEVLLRICDAVEMSRNEHLPDNTEKNQIEPLKKKWFWF